MDPEVLRRRLAALPTAEPRQERPGPSGRPAHPAAVLLPLYQHQGAWQLLFIRRAQHDNDRHSGQVAFPGGRHEADDAHAVETALREAEER